MCAEGYFLWLLGISNILLLLYIGLQNKKYTNSWMGEKD